MRRLFLMIGVFALVAASLLHTIPARAQSGVTWQTEYFGNPYLIGPALVKGNAYNALAFNWGTGSPGGAMPADGWSARFVTDVHFTAGSYRMYVLADDGVNLVVGYKPLAALEINTFGAPRPGQLLTGDMTVGDGVYHIQIDYLENTGGAYLYVAWEPLDGSLSGPNFPTYVAPAPAPTTPSVSNNPWAVQYFNNPNLSGVPNAVLTETSPTHIWGNGSPASGINFDGWSARWTSVQQLAGGSYTVTVRADDGVRVYVDGGLLINEWHGASGQTYSKTFSAAAGSHSFVVEYYDYSLAASLEYSLTGSASGLPLNGPAARVLAYKLNVRSAPLTGRILLQIALNTTYPVVGRTADSSWWLINVNGVSGWVSGSYVTVSNAAAVPVHSFG